MTSAASGASRSGGGGGGGDGCGGEAEARVEETASFWLLVADAGAAKMTPELPKRSRK